MRQRLGMALAQIEVARVRRDRKRLLSEAEKAGVHGPSGYTSLTGAGTAGRTTARRLAGARGTGQQTGTRDPGGAEAVANSVNGRIEAGLRGYADEEVRLPKRL